LLAQQKALLFRETKPLSGICLIHLKASPSSQSVIRRVKLAATNKF